MIIRIANVGDADAVSALLMQLGYEAPAAMIAERLRLFQASLSDGAFVATEDEAVFGCISVHVHELFHANGRLGRITSLVVRTDRRGSGVGRVLVEAAEQFFKTSGCVRVEVTSGDHRAAAHRFYLNCGYVEDERRFIKVFSK